MAQTSGYQYNQGGNGNGNGNGGAELNYNNNGGGSFNDLGDGFEESSSFFKGFSSYDAPLVSGSNFDNGANGAANIDVRLQGTSGASASSSVYGGSDINLVQGQSKTIDLTGGSSGGRRVVYKPVIKQGEPIITKNFYVVSILIFKIKMEINEIYQHAAPEDDEDVQVEERVQVVRPQKSYKIIFIKAPTAASSYNAANYPIYPQVRIFYSNLFTISHSFTPHRTKRKQLSMSCPRKMIKSLTLVKFHNHQLQLLINLRSSSLSTRLSKKLLKLSLIFKVKI